MNALAIGALRVAVVLIAVGTVVAQVIAVVVANEMAHSYPEFAALAPPLVALVIATIVCAQVSLVARWTLLARVHHGVIFDREALRAVDVILAMVALATLLVAGVGMIVSQTGPPALGLLIGAAIIAGAALALLIVVMRGLLVSATELETELAEVV